MKNIESELNIVTGLMADGLRDSILDGDLESFVMNGSKLIRSVLAILFFKSQNIELNEDFYKILSSGEFIHNSSLLHDDVLDEAETRRGVTTIAKKYSSKISILAGDYLLSTAIENLLDIKNFEILDLFRICIKKMSEAEINQFMLRNKMPSKDEYLAICQAKTAELFSTIMETCAMIVQSDRVKSKQFGTLFGLCFQIKNDINKDSALIDKKNGIYTAVDIFGIEKTNSLLDNYKGELINIISEFEKNIYTERLKDLVKNL